MVNPALLAPTHVNMASPFLEDLLTNYNYRTLLYIPYYHYYLFNFPHPILQGTPIHGKYRISSRILFDLSFRKTFKN